MSPDVLTQDGSSQSLITVSARGINGEPLRNISLRNEITVGGMPVDFGKLSARNAVTGADGRATFVYTAPPSPAVAVDAFTVVDIVVTPIGSDFNNSASRTAAIRLVPPGYVAPPDGLVADFTISNANPLDHETVIFDASGSRSHASNPITSYRWNFGDGATSSGQVVTHDYDDAGTYAVRLTIGDAFGREVTTVKSITVGAGNDPAASFVVSPTAPAGEHAGQLQRLRFARGNRTVDRQLSLGLRRRHADRHRRRTDRSGTPSRLRRATPSR